MVVYVDVLIILNLFVDYFLLLGCCVLLKFNVKKRRLILGALVGSLFSLIIFISDLNFLLFLILKIISGILLVLITFGFKTQTLFFKILLVFLIENFIFVGVMFSVWLFFSPPGMLWQNGVTYIAISPIILISGSVVAYFVTCFLNLIFSKCVDCKKIYKIKIKYDNLEVQLSALYDTGNCLTDPFSKRPICVCELKAVKKILPQNLINFLQDFINYSFKSDDLKSFKQVKLVPCNTISGETIIPIFLPQSVFVLCDNEEIFYDCCIGVINKKLSDGEYEAIVGDFK